MLKRDIKEIKNLDETTLSEIKKKNNWMGLVWHIHITKEKG